MTLNSFSSGVNTSFSSELNSNFNSLKIVDIYTSTGFDVNRTTSGEGTSSYEFSAIASSTINNADYLNIVADVYSNLDDGSGYNVYTGLEIEVKEVGGAYGTVYDSKLLNWGTSNADGVESQNSVNYIHTLTAGEKSNGVQVRITGKAYVQNATGGTSAVITNTQTRLQLMY